MTANVDVTNAIVSALVEQIAKANAAAGKVAAQNVGKMVHDLRESSDDELVLRFRAFVEDLDSKREAAFTKIDEHIRTNLVSTDENVNVEAEKIAFNAAKDAVNGGKALAVQMGITLPDDLPELKSLRGGNAGGGPTGPKPRVRLITVDGNEIVKETVKDGVTKRTSNFTLAAQKISSLAGVKVEAGDLSAATFEAAGTTDLKTVPGKEFSFTHTVAKADGASQNFALVVYTPAPVE